MSDATSETENSDWTQENLRKLFAAMKETIPKRCIMFAYSKTLGVMDWTKVAFPPFSPEACQRKWAEIMQKMRKYRSLTELIDEAENDIQSEVESTEGFVGYPAKWTRARMSARDYMKVCDKRWQNLTDKQKKHRVRCGVKPLHLDAKEMGTGVSEKSSFNLPSDSEDEDIEYSSSEEEAVDQDLHEGEEEEEEGDIMFDIY